MNPKPGISSFSAPLWTSGYVWRFNSGLATDNISVVLDAIYSTQDKNHNLECINHWSWLPKYDMPLAEFVKVCEYILLVASTYIKKVLDTAQSQRVTPASMDEYNGNDIPNTSVRMPKVGIPTRNVVGPAPFSLTGVLRVSLRVCCFCIVVRACVRVVCVACE